MKNSLIILTFFITGVLFGLFEFVPVIFKKTDFSLYALYLLMFLVGVGIGSDLKAFRIIKKLHIRILVIPITTIIGTLIGTYLISFLLTDISTQHSITVGFGFGYYSLSSIYISKICGDTLGVIALLSNISREIITLVFTPLFVKYFDKLAPISSGGATSMDTTLPIITKYSGKEYAIISVFHGTVLTILVPFIIPLILSNI